MRHSFFIIMFLLLFFQPAGNAQVSVSNRIYKTIQTVRATKFHKTLEYHRKDITQSVVLFKKHLEVYPVSEGDSSLAEIKTGYEKVRKQYNFALERLKIDLSNPRQMRKFLRNPKRKSTPYLKEIKKAHEDYRFMVQRRIDEITQGAYSSLPVFEVVIGAWTIYQMVEKIIRHFIGYSNEWKQEYQKIAPELLETYYFADLRLPSWEELN